MATADIDVDFFTAAGFDAAVVELVSQHLQLRRQRIADGDTRLAELVAAEDAATAELLPRVAAYLVPLIPCSITWQAILDSVECRVYCQCRAALASYEAGLDQKSQSSQST
jgi:hypothetical protein